MNNGMDNSLLDAYLYEENNLLDQLDNLLVADEKDGDFSSDDVNEIFRIMHTIKGSSAMMEFNAISSHRRRILLYSGKRDRIPEYSPQKRTV